MRSAAMRFAPAAEGIELSSSNMRIAHVSANKVSKTNNRTKHACNRSIYAGKYS